MNLSWLRLMICSVRLKWGRGMTSHRRRTSPCLSWKRRPASIPRDRRMSQMRDQFWTGTFSCSFWNKTPEVRSQFLMFTDHYLQHGTVDEVFLQKGLGWHVVHDGGGEVLEDGVHGVARLLAGDPQVLLERSGYRREDGLCSFIGIQWTSGTCNIMLYSSANQCN